MVRLKEGFFSADLGYFKNLMVTDLSHVIILEGVVT